MAYERGAKVALASHGATVVDEIDGDAVVLTFPCLKVKIIATADGLVPVEQAIGAAGVPGVLSALSGGPEPAPIAWSQRHSTYMAALDSTSSARVAEVVRDLSRRQAAGALSPGERRVLIKAREILTSHIAVHDDLRTAAAEALIDGALAR